MNPSLIILVVIAVAVAALVLVRGGPPLLMEGLDTSWRLLLSVGPQILMGFTLAGLVTVLLPADLLARVVGEDSGVRGLLIATVAGLATPGGPFLQFPLMAAILGAGAGVGPVAAYLTAWSLLGWNRVLVYELPLLGSTFTLSRVVVSLALPFVVGWTVPLLMRLLASDRAVGP